LLVGIFSERDYARKVILHGKASKETRVGAIMSDKVLYVTPEQTVDECMAIMTEKHFRHLPVLAEGKVVGIVSIGDVVKETICEQKFIIEQMEKYITGYCFAGVGPRRKATTKQPSRRSPNWLERPSGNLASRPALVLAYLVPSAP
jgi:predicted transcriptional regulator